ncbi:hypothetical protein BJX65DRAFT_313408 [Aspergillus insuetus]
MAKAKRQHSEAFACSSSTNQENAAASQEPAAATAAPVITSSEENAFKDCVVAICGHHEPYKTAALKEMISRLGAQSSRIVKKSTTHLVTTETEVHSDTKQVARARKFPTCSIVSLQWLLDSEKAGTPLPVERYRLDTSTTTAEHQAHTTNDTATSAAEQQDAGNAIETPGIDEHLFTFQLNIPQPQSVTRSTEKNGNVDTSERPAKKQRIRRADQEWDNEGQVQTVAHHTVAVPEEQPATTLAQPDTRAPARHTAVQTPHNEEEVNKHVDPTYGQQRVLDQGFHQGVHEATYPNTPTALNMMPSAQTHTQPHGQQAVISQRHAQTTQYHEAVNNNPGQQNQGQHWGLQQGLQQARYHNHNHPAATNAANMVPVTTAQELIRNGQYPANFPQLQEQQPESGWARGRRLPIPNYARSTWNQYNAVRGGHYSSQELEPERPRAGQEILYYNPAAGEPILMPGYVDPEYARALAWFYQRGNQ